MDTCAVCFFLKTPIWMLASVHLSYSHQRLVLLKKRKSHLILCTFSLPESYFIGAHSFFLLMFLLCKDGSVNSENCNFQKEREWTSLQTCVLVFTVNVLL